MSYMGKIEGRIKIPTGGWDTTVGGVTATIAAGTYYLSSADSTSEDFLAALATAWAAAAGTTCSITASLGENGTGIVTITFGSAKAITWIDTEIRDLLGFVSDQSSATSHVGTRSARAVWLPSCHYKAPEVPSANFKGLPFTDARMVSNTAGYSWHVAGQMHYQLPIEWPAVSAAKTRISQEITRHTSFERFWRDNIFGAGPWAKPGGPVRLYPNAADDETYVEYRVMEPLGSFEPQPLLEGLPTGPHRVAMRLLAVGDDPLDSATTSLPTFVAAGTPVCLGTAITVTWPTHVADDIGLLFITTDSSEASTLATPAGFVEIADSPQDAGVITTGTRLTVFWCRATSAAMTSPVTNDSGNFQFGVILTFRDCVSSGNPWDVTAGDTNEGGSTAVSIPGDTTTGPNRLIVAACSHATDTALAQFSGWANADLGDVTERFDASDTPSNGGGIGIATGTKASAGAFGATTATLATSSPQARICIALKGE